VEIALQAAMSHTKRVKFISIEGAYHGHSIGAMSIGLNTFRDRFTNLLPNCYKIKPPLDVRAAREIEKLLSNRDVAAYISEPVVLNLGVVIPEKYYFDIVQHACKKYGTLLIMDEVATGFGRTGKLFASEHYSLKPDIMCLGKALTGGYAAMGATIMTEEVARSMGYDFSFYSTFGWHPRNVIASLANIHYLFSRKTQILQNVARMSTYFTKRLRQMKFKYTPHIRIMGLAIGIEFQHKEYANEIVANGEKKGVLMSSLGQNIITLFPALTIDEETARKGLDIFEKCI